MLYPITFAPIYKERVWGGRNLETLFHRTLPEGRPIGESWEISDRDLDCSVIANGPLAGKNLHWLMEHYDHQLLGLLAAKYTRYPLLVKTLDCKDNLSLQVHPPESTAAELKGEPKTEMWFFIRTDPGAEIFMD